MGHVNGTSSLEESKSFSAMLYLTWAPGRDRFAVETVPFFGSLAVHGSYGSCLLAGFGGSVRAVPVRFQNLLIYNGLRNMDLADLLS